MRPTARSSRTTVRRHERSASWTIAAAISTWRKYWAEALARRDNSTALSARFKPLAKALEENEAKINAELIAAQGKPVDTGGYYLPDQAKTSAGMRPSATLNAALAAL